MKKRILAMLLTVCMVLSMLPMSALAARVDDEPIADLPLGEEVHDHDHAHEAALPANAADAAQPAATAEGDETPQPVAMAQLGTSNAFNGGQVDLSKALYTFTANEDGTAYTVSATVPGTTTTVYLNNTGSSGTQANQTESIAYIFTLNDSENGWFHIKTASNVYVFFEDSAWKNSTELRFNRMTNPTDTTPSGYNLALFRAATENDTSTPDIPGYVKVTEITNGAQYLVAHQSPDGNWYVLYPSNVSSAYEHVAKVVSMSFTEDIRDERISVPADYAELDIAGVTATAPSQHGADTATSGDGPAGHAVDNNNNTFWHSNWGGGSKGHTNAFSARERYGENYIQLNLTATTELVALRYLQRQGNQNGRIEGYEVRVSTDETNWTTVARGTFGTSDENWKIANFGRVVEAQYVRLYVTASHTADITAAELRLVAAPTQHTVTFQDGDVTTTKQAYEFSTLGEDLPVPSARDGQTFLGWYTVDGTVFDGSVVVMSDVTVHSEWRKTTLAEANENGTWDIDYNTYTLTAASNDGNGPEKAKDDDTTSFWHSNYSASTEADRWITIDLGEAKPVSGFHYHPRTGADNGNGYVSEYAIEVSNDGEHWTRVAHGDWGITYNNTNTHTWHTAQFPEQTVQYVKLIGVQTSGSQGGRFMNAAEIRAIGPSMDVLDVEEQGSFTHPTGWGVYSGNEKALYTEGADAAGDHGVWYSTPRDMTYKGDSLCMDFGHAVEIHQIRAVVGAGDGDKWNEYALQYSADGKTWSTLKKYTEANRNKGSDSGTDIHNERLETPVIARYLSLVNMHEEPMNKWVKFRKFIAFGDNNPSVDNYTVSFNEDGGSDVADKTVPYCSDVGELPVPTKTGYGFNGWFLEDGTQLTADTVVTGDVAVTARWTANEYIVTFVNEGAENITKTVDYGSVLGDDLPAPEKEHYTFDGWFLEDGTEFTAETVVTEDVTATAKWTLDPTGAVATIGAGDDLVYYWSLQSALKAANGTGATVTLLVNDKQTIDLAAYGESLSNVTLTAADGVVSEGITVTGNGALREFVFRGIDFSAAGHCVSMAGAGPDETVADIIFVDCTFTCAGKNEQSNIGIRLYGSSAEYPYTNITVENCQFTHCGQGVYANTVNNLTVTGSTFTDIGTYGTAGVVIHPGDTAAKGTITITGNTINDCINRPVIAFQMAEDATMLVENNTFTHIGGRFMLMTRRDRQDNITVVNNTWDGMTVSEDVKMSVRNDESYGMLTASYGVDPVVEVYRDGYDYYNVVYILASADSAVYFANKEDLKTLCFVAEGTYDLRGLKNADTEIMADDDLKIIDNGDGTITVEAKNYVAQVTTEAGVTKNYESFETALAAAQSGDTVTLLANVALTEQVVLDKAITLDGGNFTATVANGVAERGAFLVTANGAAIQNLTITAAEGADPKTHGVQVYNAENVTLSGLTITNMGKDALLVNGSTVTVDGITTSGNAWGAINVNNGGKLTVTNATLAEDSQIWAEPDSNAIITAADFVPVYGMKDGMLHYKTETKADAVTVAKIGATRYATLQSAFNAAQAGTTTTITLTQDVTEDATLDNSAAVLLDTDGNTVKATVFVENAGSSLTFKGNSDTTERGHDGSVDNNFIVKNGAELTIESGNIVTGCTAVYVESGAATVKAGAFSVGGDKAYGTKYLLNLWDKAENASITVEGGSFLEYDPANSASENPKMDFVAPLCAVQSENGTYTVVEAAAQLTSLATGKTKGYASVDAAIADADLGDTVTVRQNVNGAIAIPDDKAVQIAFAEGVAAAEIDSQAAAMNRDANSNPVTPGFKLYGGLEACVAAELLVRGPEATYETYHAYSRFELYESVTLTKDMKLPRRNASASFLVVDAKGDVTIDLAGYTISQNTSADIGDREPGKDGFCAIAVKKGTNLTVQNGTITGAANSVQLEDGASMTVENATINTKGTSYNNQYGATVNLFGGEFIMKEGAVLSAPVSGASYGPLWALGDSKITIEAGQVTVGKYGLVIASEGTTVDYNITGGTFDMDLTNAVDGAGNSYLDNSAYWSKQDPNAETWTVSTKKVAEIVGGNMYTSLQAAIDAAGDEAEVRLLVSTTESVTISGDKEITLNIPEDVTLTNEAGKHTIVVKDGAYVAIEGSGTVDNVSHKCAALVNYGEVLLDVDYEDDESTGVTFDRSKEAGTDANTSGGNSYYTIDNQGSMQINAGTVQQDGAYSSLIRNLGAKDDEDKGYLMIGATTLSGGLNNIKNDDWGELSVFGGTFENAAQYAVMNWSEADLDGGTYDQTVWNGTYTNKAGELAGVGTLRISGDAEFTGETSLKVKDGTVSISGNPTFTGDVVIEDGEKVSISGGTFTTANVNDYCVEGKCQNPAQNGGKVGAHAMGELIPQVDPKVGVPGTKAHYECSVCGQLFDENKNEVTEADLVIPALTGAEVVGDTIADALANNKFVGVIGSAVDGDMTQIVATVDSGYNGTLTVPYAKVDTGKLTLGVGMKGVESLGMAPDAVRSHVLDTNLGHKSVDLNNYKDFLTLSDWKGFSTNVTVVNPGQDNKSVTYAFAVDNANDQVTLKANTDEAAARAAWKAIFQNTEAAVGANNSKIVAKEGSYFQAGTTKVELQQTGDLVVDNFSSLNTAALKNMFKVTEAAESSKVTFFLKKGSTLAVGTSSVTLTKDVTISSDNLKTEDVAQMVNLAKALASGNLSADDQKVLTMVLLGNIASLPNSVEGATTTTKVPMNLTIEFACEHDLVLVPEVPAALHKEGVKAHYKCSICGKLFDLDKNEVTEDKLVIPALGSQGTVIALNANGTVSGNTVTYGSETKVDFTAEGNDLGRAPNHWWVGMKVIAPEGVDVSKATYTVKMPWDDKESENKDWTKNEDGTFWAPVDQAYLDRFGAGDPKALTFTYTFNWDGEGEAEQTVTMTAVNGIVLKMDNVVATTGSLYYGTVKDAVAAIKTTGTVTLLKNHAESVTIPGGKNITLELNGKTLTHDPKQVSYQDESAHSRDLPDTLYVKKDATLTVVDNSEEKTGHVIVTTNEAQAVFNEGTVILEGGTYERTAAQGYVITNHGVKMTIKEGVTAKTNSNNSALVTNGYMQNYPASEGADNERVCWDDSEKAQNARYPEMVITGGTFTGGKHVINNDHYGVMTITGEPVVTASTTPDAEGKTTVNAFRNEPTATATIEGGTFTGNTVNNDENTKALQISGGTFTADVDDYCVEGKCQNPEKRNGAVGDHVEVTDKGWAPSYIAAGKTEGKHCDVCGDTLVAQETIPMLNLAHITAYGGGHVYNDKSNFVTVIFDSASDALTFAADGNSFGRTPNKWWAGIHVSDADGVNNATYQKIGKWWLDNGTATDWTNAAAVQADGQYWAMVTPAYMEQFQQGGQLTYRFRFDWNGDGEIDQTVTILVKNDVIFSEEGLIAETNGVIYPTIAEAVAAAEDGGTVKLLKSTTESVTISGDKEITLNIPEGVTLTNEAGKHTIVVEEGAYVTITGAGTVDNVSDKRAALVNYGYAQLGNPSDESGVTFKRSAETGVDAHTSGGNSYYTIDNHGYLSLDNVTVENSGKFSSLIRNIGLEGSEDDEDPKGELHVCTDKVQLIGGLNNIKNDDWGNAMILGGTFQNAAQYAVMNWNTANILGGTFDRTVWNGTYTNEAGELAGKGWMQISGGTFNGEPSIKVQTSDPGTVSINKGTFATDVNEWCQDNDKANGYCWSAEDHTVAKHTVVTEWSKDGENHWHVCSRCGDHFDEEAHNWIKDKVVSAPTCDEKGVQSYYCDVCGATKTEDIPALGHNLTHHEEVPATCTTEGTAEYWSCKVCEKLFSDAEGKNEIDAVATLPIIDHTWGEWTTEVAATCVAKGTEKRVCAVCGEEETRETEIDPDNHTGNTEIRNAKAPTCAEEGYTGDTYCADCGVKLADGQAIAKLAHTEETIPGKAATCTETGLTDGVQCSVCGEILVAQETIAALGHDWDDGEITTAATCTEDGVKTFHCTREGCTETKTEVIPATGHNTLGLVEHKAPTCTEPGVVGGTYCTVCDHGKAEAEATIAALGHDWDDGEITTAATCTEDGVKTFHCTREGCDETKTEVIPATGHSFTNYVSNNDATCTKDGTKTAVCDHEGCNVTDTIADLGSALGHDFSTEWTHDGLYHWHACSRCDATSNVAEHVWGEDEVTEEATCTEAGLRTFTCECGATKTEVIPATGHTMVHHDAVAATCTEAGNIEYWSCETCAHLFLDVLGNTETTLDDVTIAATGHNLIRVTGKAATCTEAGNIEYWHCAHCGKLYRDAAGTDKIALADTVIAATGHTAVASADNKPATCTEPGLEGKTECSVCHEVLTEGTVIDALGHTMTHTEAVAATCTEAGNIEYWTCETCHKLFSDAEGANEITLADTVVAALGHTMTHHDAVAATCTEGGNAEYWSCETCDKLFSDAEGTAETTLEAVTTEALGHDFTKYAFDENGHWHVCAHEDCEERLPDEEATAHTWVLGPVSGGLRTDTCECGATRTQVVVSGGGGTTIIYRPTPEEDLNEPDVPLAKPFLFTDVTENDWFYEAVKDVFEKDLMEGINEEGTLFAPYQITTRGAVATLIHRMENTPAAETASVFDDVADGLWYTEAIHWTDESGVMIGFGDGTFRPDQIVTREQLALVLFRYAKFRGYDVTATGDMSLFEDAEDVSSWATDGMAWAVGSGLIKGRNGAKLAPQETTTRGELATILQRFVALTAEASEQSK